jgi:two-component system, NarL family, response regulator NreC
VTISILLADDHAIVRHGLRALLETEPDFEVVGEVDNGLAAVETAEQLQPDVLVLDLMMPGLNGLDVARQTGRCSPQTRIIILSMYTAEAYVLQALRYGAAAYVLKKSSPSELVQAIREVLAGRSFLSQSLSVSAIENYQQKLKDLPPEPYDRLTAREREVFHLTAEGQTSAQIAARLSISPRTVEMHRHHLMQKLNLDTQADLIRYAIKLGILPLDNQ